MQHPTDFATFYDTRILFLFQRGYVLGQHGVNFVPYWFDHIYGNPLSITPKLHVSLHKLFYNFPNFEQLKQICFKQS